MYSYLKEVPRCSKVFHVKYLYNVEIILQSLTK